MARSPQDTITLQVHASAHTRDAFLPVIIKFEQETNIKVVLTSYVKDSEIGTSKKQLIDIIYGHDSTRLQDLALRGEASPLNELWREKNLYNQFPAEVISWLSLGNDVYGVPYTRSTWGFFYKSSIVDKFGPVPQTWDKFVDYCVRLKESGYEVFPVSIDQPWLAAGWFEYFVLRMNGLSFYKQLVKGRISYRDRRVQNVFTQWKKVIQLGLFSEKFVEYSWQEYTPAFIRGHFVFAFMASNFIHGVQDIDKLNEINYMVFPKINDIPRYETSPSSIFYLNEKSVNKSKANKFLAFIARPDIQSFIADRLFTLPVNNNSKAPKNILPNKAHALLTSAKGVSAFYDRAIPAKIDKPSTIALSQFNLDGDVIKVTNTLEALRLKYYTADTN